MPLLALGTDRYSAVQEVPSPMAQHSSHVTLYRVSSAGFCLLLLCGTPVTAADPEVEAVDRAKRLLAVRGHRIAPVVLLYVWPTTAPGPDAFAMKGRIYVNPRSNIVQGAVLSRAYDVVLASLLLHEQAHLRGADELHALETELEWLVSERAAEEFIRETQRTIKDVRRKRDSPLPRED
jgi:hypothetical protein